MKRERLPDTRNAIVKKFEFGPEDNHTKGYVTIGLYDDGKPGEVFIVCNKTGSMERGLLNVISILMSLLLQYGVPLQTLVDKFAFIKFGPNGLTGNKEVPIAHSIIDFIVRWMEKQFEKENNDT